MKTIYGRLNEKKESEIVGNIFDNPEMAVKND